MTDVAAPAPIKTLSQGTVVAGDVSDLKKILRLYAVVVAVGIVPAALFMRWDWLNPSFQEATGFYPQYALMFLKGAINTLIVLVCSVAFGFLLAIPIGLVQVTGPWPLAWLARGFCTVIRGTPLLVQLWLFYYGLGEFLPLIPRDIWNSDILFGFSGITVKDILVSAWPYALLAFTLNFAGYEGEIMRGAFAGVPKGELEAARAYGMSKGKLLRRVWLPRAVHQALPTLAGEVVLQLQSTPLVATVTIADAFFVNTKVRQDLLIAYEPLMLLALLYMILTAIVVLIFARLEKLVPIKR
jgi:polar amino acid transport system permease protein